MRGKEPRAALLCGRAAAFRFLALFLLWGAPVLLAHDATEITAKARLLPDRIEIEFTLAYATAVRLAAPDSPTEFSSRGKFAGLKPVLEKRAGFAALLVRGQPLRARTTVVGLTRDEDVRIQLEFPAVAAGPVRLDALLLRTLASEAYYCLLTIYGPEKNEIRYEALRIGKPACELLTPGG